MYLHDASPPLFAQFKISLAGPKTADTSHMRLMGRPLSRASLETNRPAHMRPGQQTVAQAFSAVRKDAHGLPLQDRRIVSIVFVCRGGPGVCIADQGCLLNIVANHDLRRGGIASGVGEITKLDTIDRGRFTVI
jgi:hypothetical protein